MLCEIFRLNSKGVSLTELMIGVAISSVAALAIGHVAMRTTLVELEVNSRNNVDQFHYSALQSARNSTFIARELGIISTTGTRSNPELDRCLVGKPKGARLENGVPVPADECSKFSREAQYVEAVNTPGNKSLRNTIRMRLECSTMGCATVRVQVDSQIENATVEPRAPSRSLIQLRLPASSFFIFFRPAFAHARPPSGRAFDPSIGSEVGTGSSADPVATPRATPRATATPRGTETQRVTAAPSPAEIGRLPPTPRPEATPELPREHNNSQHNEAHGAVQKRSTVSEYPASLFAPLEQITFGDDANCPDGHFMSHVDLATRTAVCQPVLSDDADSCANNEPMHLFGGARATCQSLVNLTCGNGFGVVGLFEGQASCAPGPGAPRGPSSTPTPTPRPTATPRATPTPTATPMCIADGGNLAGVVVTPGATMQLVTEPESECCSGTAQYYIPRCATLPLVSCQQLDVARRCANSL